MLLIDDDTIRTWHRLFEEDGVDGLAGFNYGGRACQLTLEQQATLKAWIGETLPGRPARSERGSSRRSGSSPRAAPGLIALLHRLRCEYRDFGEMAKLLRRQWSPGQKSPREAQSAWKVGRWCHPDCRCRAKTI